MKITCYGPRGSLPAPSRPGFVTTAYGGNTSCYYVETGPFRVILDNGSGVAVLGDDLMKNLLLPQMKATGKMGMPFINLISHWHWDHIQGLPFCTPYFITGNTFHIHGFDPSGHEPGRIASGRTAVETMLSEQQANPHFPVAHECLPASRTYTGHPRQFSRTLWYANRSESDRPGVPASSGYVLCPTEEKARGQALFGPGALEENVLKITTIPLNHPDGCLGYRLDYMGKSIVYCTDNEPLRHPNLQITKLGQGADWILLDGQYTEDQLAKNTQVFGHGTPRACVDQAIACGAKHLVIHHHDPKNDDEAVSWMETDALVYARDNGFAHPHTVEFAQEGKSWNL